MPLTWIQELQSSPEVRKNREPVTRGRAGSMGSVPVVVPPGVLLPGVVTVGFVSVGGEGGLVVFVVVGGVVRSVVDSVEEGEVD